MKLWGCPAEIRGHAFVPVTEDFDGCF